MQNLNTTKLHPAWVVGFIDGEATFYVGVYAKSDMSVGFQVTLEFVITQHIRDAALMNSIVEFFNCGYLAKDGATKFQFRIRNVKDLENNLFPLLDAYPLQTQKALDAAAFRQVHAMILNKEHLTLEGLTKIQAIKSTMNRARMIKYK